MKRKYTLLWAYALLFAGWIIFGSRSSNPPDGRTGAPFDGNWTSCHSPSSSLDGSISITG